MKEQLKVRFPQEQDMVYKDCEIRMSNRAMSDLLYAALKSRAQIRNSYMLDYNYERKQDTYNTVHIKIFIHPDNISLFEELSKIKLRNPIKIQVN